MFITGTDTGVGKTVLTAYLLYHLRQTGCHALAMKPFCSGNRADVRLLHGLQNGELQHDEINPYYFNAPVAPLVAARRLNQRIKLTEVLECIREVEQKGEFLLIEGVGGVLVPLGEGFSVADLIRKLNCSVILVARNKLGTINQTLLTIQALRHVGMRRVNIIMMNQRRQDASTASNQQILKELLYPLPVSALPYLEGRGLRGSGFKENYIKVKKTLARILFSATLASAFRRVNANRKNPVDSRRR